MRARELRDVIEVLVVPSLDQTLKELDEKNFSRRRVRLLVRQAVDQLRGMVAANPKPSRCEHDFSHDQTTEGFGICRCGVIEENWPREVVANAGMNIGAAQGGRDGG